MYLVRRISKGLTGKGMRFQKDERSASVKTTDSVRTDKKEVVAGKKK